LRSEQPSTATATLVPGCDLPMFAHAFLAVTTAAERRAVTINATLTLTVNEFRRLFDTLLQWHSAALYRLTAVSCVIGGAIGKADVA
jgi:hypothetical protein